METNEKLAGAEGQQGGDKKTQQKFDEALQTFWAILGDAGKDLPKKKKASNDLVTKMVEELVQEKEVKFQAQLKEKIQKAVEGFNEYQKKRADKMKEFEKADETAMKEFIQVAQDLAQQIANIGELKQTYAKSVKALGKAASGQDINPE